MLGLASKPDERYLSKGIGVRFLTADSCRSHGDMVPTLVQSVQDARGVNPICGKLMTTHFTEPPRMHLGGLAERSQIATREMGPAVDLMPAELFR